MKLDILAIAVHPDDIELCCGGTLMMEKLNGKKTGIVDLTRGELGTRGTPELRLLEAQKAAQIMDVDVRENLGMADGFFQNDGAHQRRIIKMIRKYQPEIILTNALDDRHPDHGRAGHLVATAAFLSGLIKIETVDDEEQLQAAWRPKYVFHAIQDRYHEPDFVYDISPVAERKLAAIQAYASQFHSETYTADEPQTYISTPGFLDNIVGRDKMLGKMVGVPYAEGFITQKKIGIGAFDALIRNNT